MQIIERKSVLLDIEEYERLTQQLEAYRFLDEMLEQVEDELLVKMAEERAASYPKDTKPVTKDVD